LKQHFVCSHNTFHYYNVSRDLFRYVLILHSLLFLCPPQFPCFTFRLSLRPSSHVRGIHMHRSVNPVRINDLQFPFLPGITADI
jgi:hypothetical protein